MHSHCASIDTDAPNRHTQLPGNVDSVCYVFMNLYLSIFVCVHVHACVCTHTHHSSRTTVLTVVLVTGQPWKDAALIVGTS